MTSIGWRVAKAAAAIVLSLGVTGAALAQGVRQDGSVAMMELMKPGDIEDMTLGDAKAPVTVIEYASMSCPHCATFHKQSLPSLKKDFVETGKVRFIFREFPFDGRALAASMIARCVGKERFFTALDALFAEQQVWAFGDKPEEALTAIAGRFGFTQETLPSCLQNQKIYDAVLAGRQRAYEVLGVNSTPTIFINGARFRGALSPDELATAVKAALPDGMK